MLTITPKFAQERALTTLRQSWKQVCLVHDLRPDRCL